MSRPRRVEEKPQADTGELTDAVSYARGAADEAEHMLQKLQQRQHDLRRQIAAVDAENRALERDLLQQLGQWRKLDDSQQRVEDVMPQLRAVTGSLTYRLVAGMLRVVNRVRAFLLPTRRG